MLYNKNKTNISWITSQRLEGSEWATYTKKIVIEKDVKEAVYRYENDGTCSVFINGEFISSGTGRLPERVVCREVTTKLHKGENEIKLVLGTAYFQEVGFQVKNERGYWLNSAAFELCIAYADGSEEFVATDDTWQGEADGKPCEVIESMRVTEAEYDMMWRNATVWVEPELHKMPISAEVAAVAGKEFVDYENTPAPEYVYPVKLVETNMKEDNGAYIPDASKKDEAPYIIYDFGRLVVGFTEIGYETKQDTDVRFYHDFSEDINDFSQETKWRYKLRKISVLEPLPHDKNSAFVLRRRAFRYLKMEFNPDCDCVRFKSIKVKPCMFPAPNKGWFKCNDDMLTKAWSVGQYTLHVNKQQEYESCPRNEMEFFSGDGAMDALVDLYAFGEDELMNASLSIKEDPKCGGVTFTSKFDKNSIQWDYYAWRIVCLYIDFKAHANKEILNTYFEECETALLWQLERRNKFGLIFQKPCYTSTFNYVLGQNEWTCSAHRLGEKVALNCLLYASLVQMAEMAAFLGKTEKANEWTKLAGEIKNLINERLWSEEKQCYMDSLDSFVTQDGNTLAIVFGIADKDRAIKALNTMKKELWSPYGSAILNEYCAHTRDGNKTIAPVMTTYECMARFENGLPEEGLDLIRRCWGTMLKKGAGTFWEYAPNDATGRWEIPSHAWSSGCTYLLSKYVLGVKSTAPNYDSMSFEPNVCDLTEIKGVVPTPKGYVAASYKQVNENSKTVNKFEIALPKAIKLEYKLPENSTINVITY